MSLICSIKDERCGYGFFKVMSWEEEGNGGDHHKLQPLHRVRGHCCCIHVCWMDAGYSRHCFKERFGAHALDWETYSSEVELSTQYLFADTLEDLFPSTSQSTSDFAICSYETSIVAG